MAAAMQSSAEHMMAEEDQGEQQEVGIPQELFAASARGSLDAHRKIRDEALLMASGGTAPFDQAFAVAEAFARLAASLGNTQDRKTLAGLLFHRANMAGDDENAMAIAAAQGLAQLGAAADDGDEEALMFIGRAAHDGVPQSVFDLAKQLRAAGATA